MARLFGSDAELAAPVTRDCLTCQLPLTPARLKAVPDAVQCVKCVSLNGDEPPIRGRMVWSHKTAPEIEIGTQLAAQPAQMSYGPSFRLGSIKAAQDASQHVLAFPPPPDDVPTITGARMKLESEPIVTAIVIRNPSRCHPDRPRIGPSGWCMDCAIAQQEARVKSRC